VRIERRFLQWGVFLIALGALPLGVQLGWLDRTPIVDAERLWPVALIAIGFSVIVERTRVAALGTIVSAVALGLFIGGVISVGIGSIGCLGTGNQPTAFPASSGTLAPLAKVDITVDCGTATVTTQSGTQWTLSGTSDPDRRPAVDASSGTLFISNGRIDFPSFGAARSDWHLALPADEDVDLSLEMNAGDARLDLAGARLTGVSLTANAGSIKLDLSRAAALQALDATVNAGDVLVSLPAESEGASITVNAGHLGLCVPGGIGLRIDASGVLSSNNFASQGLVQDGDSWTSPELAAKGLQLYVRVTANAGTIELNPAGGCE
jgi:hypothetical protein